MPIIEIDENTKECISSKRASNPHHYMLHRITPERLLLPVPTGKDYGAMMNVLRELSCGDLWLKVECKTV